MRKSVCKVNGNTFEDRNGKLYLNGKPIVDNTVNAVVGSRLAFCVFVGGFFMGILSASLIATM